MIPTTAPQLLKLLLTRTRAALETAQLERLLPTLDHIERTQRTQLLQMVEDTFEGILPPAVPPPGSLKGRASIDPKRFKGLLSVLNKLLANTHAGTTPFVYPVASETVFGNSRDMLRLGAPQLERSMELKDLLGPGDRLTLDALHALERRGVAALQSTYIERIDPHLDKALPSSPHELLVLPEGAAGFLRSALYQVDKARQALQVAYWQALEPDLARRLFPNLPPGHKGLIWGTDGHRIHAVAVAHPPQHPLRKGKVSFVPISPLALADSDALQLHTWGYKPGAAEEVVTVTPNTLSRRDLHEFHPYDLHTVVNRVPACEGLADESPVATCKGFNVKAFKAALKNLKAEAKHRGLKISSQVPFLFKLKDGRALLIAQGPGAYDKDKAQIKMVELAERELEGWTVDRSIQTNLNPNYAIDVFGALGEDFTLVCRPDKNDPHIITSAARPYLGVVLAPIRS